MTEVTKYFQSYDNYFWQYEDSGKVIAVPGGRTIGYSQMIISEIVHHIAPQGLPQFGALLLVIAATNPHGIDTLDAILTFVLKGSDKESEEITNGFRFARLLTQIPAQYKKGNLRIELIRGLFLNSHNSIGKGRSVQIHEATKDFELSLADLLGEPLPFRQAINDFRPLSLLGRRLKTVEDILNSLTYFPDLKDDLGEFEIDDKQHTKNLIEQLIEDQQTYHVGALISRMMSGLQIPFHSSLPSKQPLGGVADITNKGNFDKLLASEHAFDDVIFMSRLANNEALYHHREVPPSDNNYNRVILIDVTLRNWGTIRTISFATMLAITNHPQNNNPCKVFLVGKSYAEIKFETTSDIIEAIQVLDSSLDPGVGLMKLFSTESIEISEIFFIGSAQSLDQPVMRLFNSEFGKRIDHWIHPTQEGQVSVYKNPRRGKRFIQEINLPLNEVWKPVKRKTKETPQQGFDSYPILFPGKNFKVIWKGRFFVYAIVNGRLLRNYNPNRTRQLFGWELLDPNFIIQGQLRAVYTHEDLSVTLLVSRSKKKFWIINMATGEEIEVLDGEKLNNATNFHVKKEYFIADYTHKFVLISMEGKTTFIDGEFNPPPSVRKSLINKEVYKNIFTIAITAKRTLRFGKHDLLLYGSNIRIDTNAYGPVGVLVKADSQRSGQFTFPDGSRIEHNKIGMLALISSNKNIPEIYVPCILNTTLGVATHDMFAGDNYFTMEPREELYLDGLIEDEDSAIKTIMGFTGLKPGPVKQMIQNRIIITSSSLVKTLQKALLEQNIKTVYRKQGVHQNIITPKDFYQSYIQAFIDQILAHGA